MMKLYDFFAKYVFQIGQQVIYYIRTPIDTQLKNVAIRNRLNETHIYDKEYVEHMNSLYKKMEECDDIKEVKEKGNFYNINYFYCVKATK